MGSQLKNQRGQALAMLALMLFVMIGFTAIAVDGGRLAHTATEVQTVLDSAATAAATALSNSNGDKAVAVAEAQAVAAQNSIEGLPASIAASDIKVKDDSVTVASTVRVTNIFAGIFQARTTRLKKTATARLVPLADGTPNARNANGTVQGSIPLAIGACHFDDFHQHKADCKKIPHHLVNIGAGNDSGWTSFSDVATDPNDLLKYLPAICDGAPRVDLPPPLKIGDLINFVPGIAANLVISSAIDSCVFTNNISTFKIPVVACSGGQFASPAPVLGFATVVVTQVQGNSLEIDVRCNAMEPGRPVAGPTADTNNFGTGFAALVE
jgi:Flp pilus assembly protein TadG